jgi:hypothetical protein
VSGSVDALRSRVAASIGGEVIFATNTIELSAFTAAFARTGTLVTNSFHAAYWGLLSGRGVHIIGYSSKFTNLAALFGFVSDSVVKVRRGDPEGLAEAIDRSRTRTPLRLIDPVAMRSALRGMNLDFAASLLPLGVAAHLKCDRLRGAICDAEPADAVKTVLTGNVGTCAGSVSVPVAARCPGSSSSRYSGFSLTPS